MALRNVVLMPRVAKEEMSRRWSLCDVSLVNLRNVDLFKTVILSKIFESMGMGVPMIVSMPKGEATEIVSNAGADLIIKAEAHFELAQATVKLRDDKKLLGDLSTGALSAAQEFSREKLAADALDSLVLAVQSYPKEKINEF